MSHLRHHLGAEKGVRLVDVATRFHQVIDLVSFFRLVSITRVHSCCYEVTLTPVSLGSQEASFPPVSGRTERAVFGVCADWYHREYWSRIFYLVVR